MSNYQEILRKLHNKDFKIENTKEIASYNVQQCQEKNIFELMATCCKYVYDTKEDVPEGFWRDLLKQAEVASSSLSKSDERLYSFFNDIIVEIIRYIEICWALGKGDE